MSAQSGLGVAEVEIRCDRCARDLGARAPLLAVVQREGSTQPDHWRLSRVARLSRPNAAELGTASVPSPRTILLAVAGFERPNDLPRRGGVELACRRCRARPRMRVRELSELAARATAEGRRIAYC